ncbi:MAG: hypothetical protein NZ603_06855, partial [Acidimicrobiales bacterium]|nr:hypothetical protein [Acidimicrobiales bacterium]
RRSSGTATVIGATGRRNQRQAQHRRANPPPSTAHGCHLPVDIGWRKVIDVTVTDRIIVGCRAPGKSLTS